MGPNTSDLCIAGPEFENNIVIFEINTLEYLSTKFRGKLKRPKFGTKNALFGYFWDRNFKIILSYLKWAPSDLTNSKISWNNENTKFGTKNALYEYFGARIFKNYCQIWNQHPQNFLIAKFCKSTKMPKFLTEDAFFRSFWARIF